MGGKGLIDMETRSPFLLKLLPSFGDVAFLLPIGFLFARMNGCGTLLGDGDTGWHIRTGEWILANRAVPANDIFSYSKEGAPWFAWEWLSDVAFAWLHRAGGLEAVALFGVLMLALVFALLFRMMRRTANPLVAIAVTIMAVAASSTHWLARPHLFTLLFLVLFYSALERRRAGHTRTAGIPVLALLPAATILWANLHGGFIAGILMLATYGAGEGVKAALAGNAEMRGEHGRAARGYLLSALACLAASLANPYFYRLHMHMGWYLFNPFNSRHIVEFLSPNFHHPAAIFFEAMLALGAAAACWRLAQGRFIEPLLLLVWAHAGLLANRNIPLFMIVAAPVVASAVQEWLERAPEWNLSDRVKAALAQFQRIAASTSETDSVSRYRLVSAGAVLLVAAIMWAPNPPKKFRAEFDPNRYPVAALATLRENSQARIFTDDVWGDYLIWSLYPQHKVFLDGRTDFYGNEFEETCIDVLKVKYGWEETLGRFGVDTIVLPPSAPLAGALKESRRWRVVYDDGVAVVFRSVENPSGRQVSVAGLGSGLSRGRKVTKHQSRDRLITAIHTKT
jgi:hypothetical protein